MTAQRGARNENAWAQIERDKQIDKRLRRVSVLAWTVTIVLTLVFTVLTGLQLSQFLRPVMDGQLPAGILAGAAFPLLIVLGLLSTLIATLATVGIFLRLRTASLQEIQLRLAALEEMLMRDDSDRGRQQQG
jgi:cytochrome bd-type quinol oxidase subunit 2